MAALIAFVRKCCCCCCPCHCCCCHGCHNCHCCGCHGCGGGCGNCCGGFGCPVCNSCGCGNSLTFPCSFGACVNNPCCECCKTKPKKGYCQWPCCWPCCCECKLPQFKLKPLKPKPVCCGKGGSHEGCGCCHRSPAKRQFDDGCGGGCGCSEAGPPCDLCAQGAMCSNCKGGFYPPVTCGGCNSGCCPSLTFPCTFGACVNNPACECCKEPTPPGKCKWPCMWPCCCECTPPKFDFKPLKPKPVCHCPSHHGQHTACGCHCARRSCRGHNARGPVKRDVRPVPYGGYAFPTYTFGPVVNFMRGPQLAPFPF